MSVSEDALKLIDGVWNSLGRGVSRAQKMAVFVDKEIEAGRGDNFDPITTEARERVIGLWRGYCEAIRGREEPGVAALFGAALAFAVVQFESLIEGLDQDFDTGVRTRAGLELGRSRRPPIAARNAKIRKEMATMIEAGHSIRAAALSISPKHRLSLETIRKIYSKPG